MVDTVSAWFAEHPLYDSAGQPIVVPEWSFPGRGRVQGQLTRAKDILDRAEKVLGALPLRGPPGRVVGHHRGEAHRGGPGPRLRRALRRLRRVRGRLRRRPPARAVRVAARRGPARLRLRPPGHRLDPLRRGHPPPVVRDQRPGPDHAGGRTGPTREDRLRAQVLAPERQLAAFDLENTLIASNVVASYAWLASRRLSPPDRITFVAPPCATPRAGWPQDRRDRSDFLRFFYRHYEGAPVDQLEEDSAEMFSRLLLTKSFPAAIRRVREHRASATAPCSSPVPSTWWWPRWPRCSTTSSRPSCDATAGCSPASCSTCPPPARPGPRPSWTTPPPTTWTCAKRWPTPTRPATCPCSTWSASPWP